MISFSFDSCDFVGAGYFDGSIKVVSFFGLGILVVGEAGSTQYKPVLTPLWRGTFLLYQQPALTHGGCPLQRLLFGVLILGDLKNHIMCIFCKEN